MAPARTGISAIREEIRRKPTKVSVKTATAIARAASQAAASTKVAASSPAPATSAQQRLAAFQATQTTEETEGLGLGRC